MSQLRTSDMRAAISAGRSGRLKVFCGRSFSTAPGLIRSRRGVALVTTLILMTVILFLGTFALMGTRSEIRTSANYRGRVQAQYFAESGLDELVGYQNDLTASPRYLFDPVNYQSLSSDSSVLREKNAVDPETGKVIGSIHRVILDKDPTASSPPYRVRSTATLADGSQSIYEVEVDALSLLDYALYAEASLWYSPPGLTMGRVYSAGDITILAGTEKEVFMKRVDYAGNLVGESNADFNEGHAKIVAYPPLTSLVNMPFYESAARQVGKCEKTGIGLYIGDSGGVPSVVRDQSRDLFELDDNSDPGADDIDEDPGDSDWDDGDEGVAVTGCKDTSGNDCWQIDLTLFDFKANPITYGGVALRDWNGNLLRPTTFNGVIYVQDELHVWGILGGRSPEDRVVVDKVTSYDVGLRRPTDYPNEDGNPDTEAIPNAARGKPFHHHPQFDELNAPWNTHIANRYSNNQLDPGEDTNGNGILDPAGLGRSLTIVTEAGEDIIIDHNIYYGTDPNGTRVSLGLLSGDAVLIDPNAPRVLLATAAKLGRGTDRYWGWNGSFVALPITDQTTHRRNLWAKAAGESVPSDSTYIYDLDLDGEIETNNGQGLPGDRNESKIRDAWAAPDLGNLTTLGGVTYGAWSSGLHPVIMAYDFELASSEPPCWPVLPYYGMVPGSFNEITN